MSEEYTVVSRRQYDGKEYIKLQRDMNGNAGSESRGKFRDTTNRYGRFGWTRRSGVGGKGKGSGGKGPGKGSGRSPDTKPTQSKHSGICYKWNGKEGSCPFGETCKFQHREEPKEFCKFFQKGTCNRGAACRFGHNTKSEPKVELTSEESRFADSMAQVLKTKVGLDESSAADMAKDCARNWPDPRVAKLAAVAAEGGTPLDPRAMQEIEKLVASQKRTQDQIGALQKQIVEGRQAFQASSSESKEVQKAVEASLKAWRSEQSSMSSSRRGEALEAEQLQRALDESLKQMRKDSLDRETKWKEETLEEVLRKIRSEDVKRLEGITLGLRKEITRLQLVERELGKVKHEKAVLQTNLMETEMKLDREREESKTLRQLLGRSRLGEEAQGRIAVQSSERADRSGLSGLSDAVGVLNFQASEELNRRKLMREFLTLPCTIDNDWVSMEWAKWESAILDPDSGIRGLSLQPGRASDAEPPALVETPDQNRRRKSGARDPEIQSSSMTSRVAGLAIRLYESISPAPKKSRAGEEDRAVQSEDSEGNADIGRDRDRDNRRINPEDGTQSTSASGQSAEKRSEWRVGQLVLAKEDRKGDFREAEIVQTDKKLGVQVKWAESGGEKWLRKDMWAERLKESCRIEGASVGVERA